MSYFVKAPWLLKKMYPDRIWHMPHKEKNLYVTFVDGPHETATPFVLDQLSKYNAKATFFCIGKNVMEHPGLYQRIINEGHAVGNHTQNHLNGWETSGTEYIQNILETKKYIDTNLFRPPYGRITKKQALLLHETIPNLNIIMWSVLSGDFDNKISSEKCLKNVIVKSEPGSILVFHDSEKAFEKLKYVLPKVLEYFSGRGFQFKKISINK